MNQRIPRPLIGQMTQLFLLGTGVSVVLYVTGSIVTGDWGYWYLVWNLFLAWVPFGLGVWLHHLLTRQRWIEWLPLGVTVLWLCFLPNTFYMITDLVHVHSEDLDIMMYNIVLLVSFIAVSVALGLASLALIHSELRRRLPARICWRIMLGIIFVVSFAIYIGRYLRWNTWDILTEPVGILFDLSERVINPTAHPQTFVTTLLFFVLLSTGYYAVWKLTELLRSAR